MDYNQLSDLELFDRLKSGDHDAFTVIYNRHGLDLINHVCNKTRDHDEAQDILHDVFDMLWTKRKTLQITTNVKGFLYTAVRNRIYNQFSHQEVKDKYINSLLRFVQEESVYADHKICGKQLAEQIEKEIQALPQNYRQVIELSIMQGRTSREIAVQLQLSEPTISRYKAAATEILKMRLRHFISLMLVP